MKQRKVFPIIIAIFLLVAPRLIYATEHYEKINVVGENAPQGIYDPSLEYNEDGSIGYMAYSQVDMPKYVHTAIAKTTDNGKTWKFVKRVNTSQAGVIKLLGKEVKGVWRHEVSTLVYDSGDPGKEWKLYWHKYFCREPYRPIDRLFTYGWIAYKYASNPEGPWSEEIPLFGAGFYPPRPYKTEINLNFLHKDLKGMLAYSEMGSLYKDGVIYLSIDGFQIGKKNKTFLLASYNHGKSWKYLGTMLTDEDGERLGYDYFVGSSLVKVGEKVYLLMSTGAYPHNGTYVFEFEDLKHARLKKDPGGNVIIYKYIPTSFRYDGGQSDFDENNSYGGIIMSEVTIDLSTITSMQELTKKKDFMTIRNTKVFIE